MLYVVSALCPRGKEERMAGRAWQTFLVWQGSTDRELNMLLGGGLWFIATQEALLPSTLPSGMKMPEGKHARSLRVNP